MEISEQRKANSAGSGAKTPRTGLRVFPFGPMAFRFWVYWTALVFPAVAHLIIFLYCRSVSKSVIEAFAPSMMVAFSTTVAGGFLGFLFAIPRAYPAGSTLPGEDENAEGRLQINTNLEQVSDWLTKIIVGVALVELGKILPSLGRLVETVASIYGDNAPGATVMAAAILIFFSVMGFFIGYIGTRSLLTVIFEAVRGSDDEE
jgi:hypothetical protein